MSQRLATERVYRTLDGRYVPHGHEDAAFLVAGVGGPLPDDCTGFDAPAPELEHEPAAEEEPEPVAEEAPAQDDDTAPAPAPVKPKKPAKG